MKNSNTTTLTTVASLASIANVVVWVSFMSFDTLGLFILLSYYSCGLVPTCLVARFHMEKRIKIGYYDNISLPFKRVFLFPISFFIVIRFCIVYFIMGIFSLHNCYKNFKEKMASL